jgi:eukaryotic-like serine/threonine-protein kinase
MDETREDRLEELFEAAMVLPPEQRAHFVGEACRGDSALASEVLALLEHADGLGDPLHAAVERAVGAYAGALMGEPSADEDDPLIGRRTGHYLILDRLGAGGMGRVYRARDVRLDRPVALKFLPPHLGSDPAARRRLIAEAKAASALDHPNICTIHEISEADLRGDPRHGSLFIAMACYDGETIAAKLAHGPLPMEEAIEYAVQTADALVAANQAGLVHRDLKPANLMVAKGGRIKILDFGVAKSAVADVTAEGATRGTLAYMSPEQTRGEAVDARGDLWALGVVLYEMLTGVRPFPSPEEALLVHQIRHETPAPVAGLCPEVPRALERIVERCLRKAPAERYAHAGELLADLRALRAGEALDPPPRPRRRRVAAVGIAAIGTLALATATLLLLPGRSADPEAAPPGEAAVATSGAVPRLAVLPFANLRADTATDFLGYALADEIIGRLGRIDGLILRPSSAVRRYHGQVIDVQEVAGALGVDLLLTGTYLRDGAALRVNLEMVNTATGEPQWQEPIETDYESVFRLQDMVAQRVVQRLDLGSTPRVGARDWTAAVQPTAYHLYLRAFGYPFVTAEGNRAAYELLRRSVELDSTYAPAFTALGYRAYQLGYHGFTDEPEQALAEAERAFARALALDPDDLQVLSFQALLLLVSGRLEEALQPLRQALAIQPNADTYISLGHIYRQAGLFEESVRSFERAGALDPTNHRLNLAGTVYHYLGRYEEAMESFMLDPYSPPSLAMQGLLLLEWGRPEAAAERFEALVAGGQGGPWFGLTAEALLAYLQGDRAGARQRIRALERNAIASGSDGEGWYVIARMYALLDDRAGALRMLERAVDGGFFAYPYIVADRWMESFREDAAFQTTLAKARTRHEAFRALVAAHGQVIDVQESRAPWGSASSSPARTSTSARR